MQNCIMSSGPFPVLEESDMHSVAVRSSQPLSHWDLSVPAIVGANEASEEPNHNGRSNYPVFRNTGMALRNQ